jgi:hypothetical protein
MGEGRRRREAAAGRKVIVRQVEMDEKNPIGNVLRLHEAGFLKGIVVVAVVQTPDEPGHVEVSHTGLSLFDRTVALGAAYIDVSAKLQAEGGDEGGG